MPIPYSDSVMPSQRYALPRLEGVCPKEQFVPEIERLVDFTIPLFLSEYKKNQNGGPPIQNSRIDCNLHIKTTFWQTHEMIL